MSIFNENDNGDFGSWFNQNISGRTSEDAEVGAEHDQLDAENEGVFVHVVCDVDNQFVADADIAAAEATAVRAAAPMFGELELIESRANAGRWNGRFSMVFQASTSPVQAVGQMVGVGAGIVGENVVDAEIHLFDSASI